MIKGSFIKYITIPDSVPGSKISESKSIRLRFKLDAELNKA